VPLLQRGDDDDMPPVIVQPVAAPAVLHLDAELPICAICHNDLEGGDERTLRCGHTFHVICIDRWWQQLQQDHLPLRCPNCRVEHVVDIVEGVEPVDDVPEDVAVVAVVDDPFNPHYLINVRRAIVRDIAPLWSEENGILDDAPWEVLISMK